MEFFVPYNMIAFFNQKSGKTTGNYRHILSQRIYLFLLHCYSGRIHESNISELTKFFGSSKLNIQKALSTLLEWDVIDFQNGYYVAKGQEKFTNLKGGSDIRFYKFDHLDLLNPKRFKALIFKYLGQEVAFKKGLKLSNGLKVKINKTTGKYFVTDVIREKADNRFQTSDIEDLSYNSDLLNSVSVINNNPTITDLVQKQALSYLGKAIDRSSRSVSRKIKTIRQGEENQLGEDLVVFKSNKVKSLSNCGFEHLKFDDEQLSTKPWITVFESDYSDECFEMLENFSGRFPITSEGGFVAAVSNGFGVFTRKINKLTYTKINETTKTNRKVKFRIKG